MVGVSESYHSIMAMKPTLNGELKSMNKSSEVVMSHGLLFSILGAIEIMCHLVESPYGPVFMGLRYCVMQSSGNIIERSWLHHYVVM